ncbi:MAG: PQQ-binding-like beta-propeller repeat protein [Nitrospiraceae bacterium]|nr:PQQ-binding-like beta-propeller repeat protein [Nitrospiraceae bacterium]
MSVRRRTYLPLAVAAMIAAVALTAWSDITIGTRIDLAGDGGFSAANYLVAPDGRPSAIVVCEGNVGVVCLDLQGERLWRYPMASPATASPAVADLDGNGRDNVVAADGTGQLAALDDAGKPLWTVQLPAGVEPHSCPAIVNLDGGPTPEILVGDLAGNLSCFSHDGTLLWRFTGDGTRMGPVLAADIYDTPGLEVIVTSHDGHIYALTAQGQWLWDLYTPDDLFPNTSPILADVDGNAVPELYIAGGLHHFYRIDLQTHAIVLAENVYLHINGAMAAADIDNDGLDEVIFGNKNGGVWCYGAGGFEWTQDFPSSSFNAGPILTDLDGDPGLEILFHCGQGNLQVIDSDGTPMDTIQTGCQPFATPLAGDFDQDGKLDMIVTALGGYHGNGRLKHLTFDTPFRKDLNRNRLQFGVNRAHTGQAPGQTFSPIPLAPAPPASPTQATFTQHGHSAILSGPNTWRFTVNNPNGKRLALITAITYPGGKTHRIIRHARAPQERAVVQFNAGEPGEYRVDTTLVDADTLVQYGVSNQRLNFQGFQDDVRFIEEQFLEATEDLLLAWRVTNPKAARAINREVTAMRGILNALEQAPPQQRAGTIPGLRADARRTLALAAAGAQLAPTGNLIAWQFNPWGHFHPRDTLPTPSNRTEQIDVALCIGEYESLAVNLTSLAPHTLDVRVAIVPGADEATPLPPGHIEFRRATLVPTIRREQVADALPKLGQGNLLRVSALQSEQLWITLNAKNLAPGDYCAKLQFQTLEPDPTTIHIPIQVHVYDLALPRPRPLRFCTWSYDGSPLGSDKPLILKDLIEHGVTVFFGQSPTAQCNAQGALTAPPDFTAHDESVHRLSPHGILLFVGPQNALSGQPFLSEPWKSAFVQYLRAWVAHMKTLGLDYKDWALYLYDEPSTPFSQTTLNTVAVAKLVKQADPNLLVYSDPTSGTTMETVEMFTGLVDIWVPSAELLERLGPEMLPVAKRVGKEVWFYDASGRSKTLSCLGLYRWRFWYAWNLGLTGAGWWCYSHGADVAWQGPNSYGDFYDTVYPAADGGVVTSKRWEAAREGIEDYEYLVLLAQAIDDAQQRGVDKTRIQAARSVLADTPPAIEAALHQAGRRLPLTPDSLPLYNQVHHALQGARKQIAATCLELNASSPAQGSTPPAQTPGDASASR